MIYKASGGTETPRCVGSPVTFNGHVRVIDYITPTPSTCEPITYLQDEQTYLVKSLPDLVGFTYFPKWRSK